MTARSSLDPRTSRTLQSGTAAVVQTALRALWLYVVPALLAATWMTFFVPPGGLGVAGWIAGAVHGAPVVAGAGLFVAFSVLAHHWRFHLPGGRYASALPADWVADERDPERLRAWASVAERHATLSSAKLRERLERRSDPESLRLYGRRLDELDAAIDVGDLEGARSAVSGLEASAGQAPGSGATLHLTLVGLAVAVALSTIFLVRARVLEPYEILSDSMLPTLERGDRILANKLAYRSGAPGRAPERGDVIVFRSSAVAIGKGDWPDILAKRVIGLPGDHIEMHGGIPVINGWAVPSCDAGRYLYVYPGGDFLQGRLYVESLGAHHYLTVRGSQMPPSAREYVVGPGEVFVLGDNRSNSVDSRSWNGGKGGGVPFGGIDGRGQWSVFDLESRGSEKLPAMLRPVDAGRPRSRLPEAEEAELEQGIARCLSSPPGDVTPPAPGLAPSSTEGGGR